MRKLLVLVVALVGIFAIAGEASAMEMTEQQVKNTCRDKLQEGGTPNGDTAMGCEKKCGSSLCTYGCVTRKGKPQECAGVVLGPTQSPNTTTGQLPLPASLSADTAFVARGGSRGGLGFSCNEPTNPRRCSCTGPIDSVDCKSMAKNCDGEISCGWAVDNCTCKHKARTKVGSQNKKPAPPPAAGRIN